MATPAACAARRGYGDASFSAQGDCGIDVRGASRWRVVRDERRGEQQRGNHAECQRIGGWGSAQVAAFAPMPRASVDTAAATNTGAFESDRLADRRPRAESDSIRTLDALVAP